MTFAIKFICPPVIAEDPLDLSRTYDPELDDVRSILRDICSSLAQVEGVSFALAFDSPVAVDVRTDLLTFLEELNVAVGQLREEEKTAIDLYEQGTELSLRCVVENDEVIVEAHDMMNRRPIAGRARLDQKAFFDALRVVANTFLNAAHQRMPRATRHEWFVEWERSLRGALGD